LFVIFKKRLTVALTVDDNNGPNAERKQKLVKVKRINKIKVLYQKQGLLPSNKIINHLIINFDMIF
jgi:hypothetical protein